MKSNIDLAQFKKDYYDPAQRVAEVAEKYGLNQYTISAFARSLGLQNRREAGIIYRPNGRPDKKTLEKFLETGSITKAVKHFHIGEKTVKNILRNGGAVVRARRVGGCNSSCPNWTHCTSTRPEVLPCEVHFWEDEFIEMDEDSVSYYHSPDWTTAVRVAE